MTRHWFAIAALGLWLFSCREAQVPPATAAGPERTAPTTQPKQAPVPAVVEERSSANADDGGGEPTEPEPPPVPIEIYANEAMGERAPDALDAFFEGLRLAEAGHTDGRVAIVQFGDSHTSSDHMTSRMRRILQARFGDAGRGFVLPGKPPLRHYHQRDIAYGSSGKWRVQRGWRSRDGTESVGMGQVRVYSKRRSASAWVETCKRCPGNRVDSFEVFFARGPKNGKFAYRVDRGDWTRIDTRLRKRDNVGPSRLGYHKVEVEDGAHRFTIEPAGGGSIELFGIALERDRPGVILDQVGIVGLQAWHLYSLDWIRVGEHLAHRDPRLVILQYGTNEADNRRLQIERMQAEYIKLIQRIQSVVPKASILLIGPPDSGVQARGRKTCKRLRKEREDAANAQRDRDVKRSKRKRKRRGDSNTGDRDKPSMGADADADADADEIEGCQYLTPSVLPSIIAAQRRAAQVTGSAFYDTFAAMGGANVMNEMHLQDPQMVYGDRVHFTQLGAHRWADMLAEQLLQAYDAWLTARSDG